MSSKNNLEKKLVLFKAKILIKKTFKELISNTSKLIKKIDLVDVYKGSQIDNAKKSYSISVTLEEKKKTLDEIEINRISEKIIKNVNKELNGKIRS